LSGIVHVDEFPVGGPEEGQPGRSQGENEVIIAVELSREGQSGRTYERVSKTFQVNPFVRYLNSM